MSKVITFSRVFPKGHPKAGQPTYFVEKIISSIGKAVVIPSEYFKQDVYLSCRAKLHTIRKGKRWKTGDVASLRIWSGEPYRSKQIAIAPDVELTVKDIEIDKGGFICIDGEEFDSMHIYESAACYARCTEALANNDGLSYYDFSRWFSDLPFSGQILIWSKNELPY